MKTRQMLKALKKQTEELRQRDIDKGIVGYALYDTKRRVFITFENVRNGPFKAYTGNIEVAYVADTREEALDAMIMKLDDYLYVKIIPLISNVIFGLSPAPGSLEHTHE